MGQVVVFFLTLFGSYFVLMVLGLGGFSWIAAFVISAVGMGKWREKKSKENPHDERYW
jgi:hypothetical protein